MGRLPRDPVRDRMSLRGENAEQIPKIPLRRDESGFCVLTGDKIHSHSFCKGVLAWGSSDAVA
jgi:hypothetical protein